MEKTIIIENSLRNTENNTKPKHPPKKENTEHKSENPNPEIEIKPITPAIRKVTGRNTGKQNQAKLPAKKGKPKNTNQESQETINIVKRKKKEKKKKRKRSNRKIYPNPSN